MLNIPIFKKKSTDKVYTYKDTKVIKIYWKAKKLVGIYKSHYL